MNWRPPLLLLEPCPGSLSGADLIPQKSPSICLQVLVCLCTHGLSHGAAACLAARRAHLLLAGPRVPVCTWTAACAWDGSTTSWPDQLGTQGDTEHRMHTGPTKVADHRKRTGFSNIAAHQRRTGWAKCRSSPDAHRSTKCCSSPLRVPKSVTQPPTVRMPKGAQAP